MQVTLTSLKQYQYRYPVVDQRLSAKPCYLAAPSVVPHPSLELVGAEVEQEQRNLEESCQQIRNIYSHNMKKNTKKIQIFST